MALRKISHPEVPRYARPRRTHSSRPAYGFLAPPDRDCHIKPDLILIYRKPDETSLELVRLGSDSELGLETYSLSSAANITRSDEGTSIHILWPSAPGKGTLVKYFRYRPTAKAS